MTAQKKARGKAESADSSQRHLAEVEIRHLKNTITTLRDKLEELRFERGEAVQQAVAGANSEITQLKATISALREQLENNRHTHEAREQELKQDARDQTRQLEETITALREALDSMAKGQ